MATRRNRNSRKSRNFRKSRNSRKIGGKESMPMRAYMPDATGKCTKAVWERSGNGVVGAREVRDCLANPRQYGI
jgi:hypothetical protein